VREKARIVSLQGNSVAHAHGGRVALSLDFRNQRLHLVWNLARVTGTSLPFVHVVNAFLQIALARASFRHVLQGKVVVVERSESDVGPLRIFACRIFQIHAQ
jgi:hypothetical protein